MDSYSIIIKDFFREKEKVKNFIKEYYSFDDEKTAAFLKKSPGFLKENAGIAQAKEIYEKTKEKDLAVLIIDDKDIPNPPPPIHFEKVEIKTSGFNYISKSIREYIPFEKINMITTGIISEEVPETSIHTISFNLRGKIEKLLNMQKPKDSPKQNPPARKEIIFYMDIFADESRHQRIKHNDFDYSCIGKEKVYSSIENFKILLGKITALSLKAFKNETTNAILKKEVLSDFIYESIDSYEKEIIWHQIVGSEIDK